MSYTYVNPTKRGANRVKLPRRVHNEIFPNRKLRKLQKAEYYLYKDNGALKIQYFTPPWVKFVIIAFFFVPSILVNGLVPTWKDTLDLIFERGRGKFTEDTVRIDKIEVKSKKLPW